MGAHISVPMYQRAIAQRYRLVGLKCRRCGKINFPPKAACKYCGELNNFEEIQLSGKGKVYSFTVIAGAGAPPEFADEAVFKGKYPVALVELDEGPRIVAQLVDTPVEDVAIGMPVEAVLRKMYTEEGVVRYGYKFRKCK
ncbi:MAG: Zn-ribbon domain-containing OB-fold protein [Bacillota bacterium]